MNKIENPRFQETYVEEVLENGLRVVLWHKPDFVKSFFLMATPLGSLDLYQEMDGKEIAFPAGIAHFLEHKMFEDEDELDVMDQFAQMGANVNAFTSYSETAYYFSTASNPIKPLHLLLDFVQKLSISEQSVEKEKGIIIQELEMYQQMSEMRILNETLASLYQQHALKYDIGGDNESVSMITKQQLEDCYQLNYHPSNMILVGVSAQDPELLLKEIKANQSKKHFAPKVSIHRKNCDEPKIVARKEHQFSMDISIPKITVSFKLDGVKNVIERNKKEWALKLLFDQYFSTLNPNYQKWMDEDIINSSFSFEIDFGDDYGLLLFYSETDKLNEFEKIIMDTLKSVDGIKQSALDSLKNRYFGMNINALNDHKQIAITYMRNYFSKIDFFEALEIVESIQVEDLYKVLKEIDLNNYCKVIIHPNAE